MSGDKLDPEGVKGKFGVLPERIVDYLTLVGDAVDNVPGVDKVGPKTAAKLIEQYGSLKASLRTRGSQGRRRRKPAARDRLAAHRAPARHGEVRRGAAVRLRRAPRQGAR
jgi:5'-3' exonuclease